MAMKISRRSFIKQVVTGSVAFPLIIPRLNFAQSANAKLQHASIAVGGMGGADLNSLLATGKVDIVAICDVNENNLNQVAANLPNARTYRDWREMLAKEADVLELEDEIHTKAQGEVDRTQREFYLREQLKVIQSELGEGDPWSREISELHSRIEGITLPEEVQVRALKEVDRLVQMPPLSPEVGIIRTYLDWIRNC